MGPDKTELHNFFRELIEEHAFKLYEESTNKKQNPKYKWDEDFWAPFLEEMNIKEKELLTQSDYMKYVTSLGSVVELVKRDMIYDDTRKGWDYLLLDGQ